MLTRYNLIQVNPSYWIKEQQYGKQCCKEALNKTIKEKGRIQLKCAKGISVWQIQTKTKLVIYKIPKKYTDALCILGFYH